MLLRRNRWMPVYQYQNGAYTGNLSLATTVVRGPLPLVLRFSPSGSGIGYYDSAKVNERVGLDRRRLGQVPESIWGEPLRKKTELPKPATKVTTSIQASGVPSELEDKRTPGSGE
jgi:hypothetical protein